MPVFRFLPAVLLAAALLPAPALGGDPAARSGSVVGDFFRRVAEILLPGSPSSEHFDRALETYETDGYFTTYVHGLRLRSEKNATFRDEADLLIGLAAARAGLRELALPALRGVLESKEASPYYAVALATLLELEAAEGNTRAGADAAEKYFTRFWRRPRTRTESAVNALFLEHGNLFAFEPALDPTPTQRKTEAAKEDRPSDRAVYLAGQALLRAKRFEKAGVCFASFKQESPYVLYARYGLAQSLYAAGKLDEGSTVFDQVYTSLARNEGERFLQHRAALMLAQISYELDEDSRAVSWLRNVSREGPYGVHAALLAAEIHASQEKPALALVYLRDGMQESGEPKMEARAAGIRAALHRKMGDVETAVTSLEQGVGALEKYAASLRALGEDREMDRLRGLLEGRAGARRNVDAWRRQNLTLAMPALVEWEYDPGWLSSLLAGWLSETAAQSPGIQPIIYYPQAFDPFGAIPAPPRPDSEPPPDSAFPAVFRRATNPAIEDALVHELRLQNALSSKDPVHLRLMLLDTELRLAIFGKKHAKKVDTAVIRELGFSGEVARLASQGRARSEVMGRALRATASASDARQRSTRIEAIGRRMLDRWRELERQLLRQAVSEEERTTGEVLYALEFDLSQAYAEREKQNDAIRRKEPGPNS